MDKHLHIVTLDVPVPADYGGAIDQFYRIVWLYKLGVKIHLHCFTKNRPPSDILNRYCETVIYYKRKLNLSGFSLSSPYIVSSRNVAALLNNLMQDKHPVLFEGVHCTYFLQKGYLQGRKTAVRLHNAEYKYYNILAKHEKKIFNKIYFSFESWLLKKYEAKLSRNNKLLAISSTDKNIYEKELNAADVTFIPAFTPWDEIISLEGMGCYCLYHGNLSINENEEVAAWLLENIFSKLPIPFVIAGKNPSQRLEKLVHKHERCCLVINPGDKELHDLIAKAQINILPSFNNTGIKLKLLNALYNGRHCLVNKAGVDGSGLESVCTIVEDAETFRNAVNFLYNTPYNASMNQQRKLLLNKYYSNESNTNKLIDIFWG